MKASEVKVVDLPRRSGPRGSRSKHLDGLLRAAELKEGQAVELQETQHVGGSGAYYLNAICIKNSIAAKVITQKRPDGKTFLYAIPYKNGVNRL